MKYRADGQFFFSRSRWRWNSCRTHLWLKVRKFQNENMESSHGPKYERKKFEKFCPEHLGQNFSNFFVHILGNTMTSYFHFEIYWPLMRAFRINFTPMWPLIARFSAVTFQTPWCKSFFTFTTRHLVSKWHPWYNATYKLERAVKNKKMVNLTITIAIYLESK